LFSAIKRSVIARRGKAPTWQSPGTMLDTACNTGDYTRRFPRPLRGLGMTSYYLLCPVNNHLPINLLKKGIFMTAFENFFTSLKNKRIAVLGLGVSNRPLVRLLLEFHCDVTGCDRTDREKLDPEVLELEKMGCRLSVGEGYLDDLQADVVFRTPGMHPNNPALVALRETGAEVTSEMEVFFKVCPCDIIAVTGSDGKTTTTTLISEMLKAEGRTVWLGGNIGTPLLPLVRQMEQTDIAVVELSSFQLMDMRRSPRVAVVTNLAPNHLDVHKDMEEYVEAKKNIFRFQSDGDLLVINADNAITAGFVGNGRTCSFSRQGEGNVCLRNGIICRNDREILRAEDILIPGVHNVENYMAAIAAVRVWFLTKLSAV